MTVTIDLLADVGEGYGDYRVGDDAALLELMTSANVACGFHAGDPEIIDAMVRSCVSRAIAVGAHPGFADLRGFGRRLIEMAPGQVRADVLYQLGALSAFAAAHRTTVAHVTPHGRLGNASVADAGYAEGVLRAVEDFDPTLPIVTQEGELARLARERGIPVAITAMADRGYEADGSLADRRAEGAVIDEPERIVDRTLRMVLEGRVETVDGTEIDLECHTVLIHGDNPHALEVARRVREALLAHGVRLAPIGDVLASRR